MNTRDTFSFDGRIVKTNGSIIPAVGRFFESCPNIPNYKVSLPWMLAEQKHTYTSNRLIFQCQATVLDREVDMPKELYYENKLYETVVGALLRSYLAKKNPGSAFYYASKYDDYLAACDYIVSPSGKPDDFFRIDLTIGDGELRSFEQNYTQMTLQSKIQKFHRNPGVPEEFFDAVRISPSSRPLPLVIIRMNRPFLRSFMNDFFKTMVTNKIGIDILEYFSSWMDSSPVTTKKRIAYILGMEKEKSGTFESERQMNELVTQIGILFAGIETVSVAKKN